MKNDEEYTIMDSSDPDSDSRVKQYRGVDVNIRDDWRIEIVFKDDKYIMDAEDAKLLGESIIRNAEKAIMYRNSKEKKEG